MTDEFFDVVGTKPAVPSHVLLFYNQFHTRWKVAKEREDLMLLDRCAQEMRKIEELYPGLTPSP